MSVRKSTLWQPQSRRTSPGPTQLSDNRLGGSLFGTFRRGTAFAWLLVG
jgi:hypothetical protein